MRAILDRFGCQFLAGEGRDPDTRRRRMRISGALNKLMVKRQRGKPEAMTAQ
jgi:hypothetical protein